MAGEKEVNKQQSAQQTASNVGHLPPPDDVDLKGFANVNPEESRAWWNRKPGSYVYGEYIGRYPKTWENDEDDAGSKWYHQLRLWRDADAKVPDKDGKTIESILKQGSIINIDESKMLESMSTLPVEDGGSGPGKWILFIRCLSKEPVKGTKKTVWRFEVKKKPFTKSDAPF